MRTLTIAAALCLSLAACTQTMSPSEKDAGDVGVDTSYQWDIRGLDHRTPDITIPDTRLQPDTAVTTDTAVVSPVQAFRLWLTGGASLSSNDQFRMIGGFRTTGGAEASNSSVKLYPWPAPADRILIQGR